MMSKDDGVEFIPVNGGGSGVRLKNSVIMSFFAKQVFAGRRIQF
jgi:hypothetical protein